MRRIISYGSKVAIHIHTPRSHNRCFNVLLGGGVGTLALFTLGSSYITRLESESSDSRTKRKDMKVVNKGKLHMIVQMYIFVI